MKKLINKIMIVGLGFSIGITCSENINAQTPAQRWFVGGNLIAGLATGSHQTTDWAANYTQSVNNNISTLNTKAGLGTAVNLEFGYFFGSKRNLGIGTGIQWSHVSNMLSLDKFGIEYKSKDAWGNDFRQVLSSVGALEERVKQHHFGIPIKFIYKAPINQKWDYHIDLGVVLNFSSYSNYKVHSSYNYEAIYKFDGNGNPVYDPNPIPDADDWLITKAHYEAMNPGGDVNAYFQGLYGEGYNVGLNVDPFSNKGTGNGLQTSVMWFLQPGLDFKVRPNMAITAGLNLMGYKASWNKQDNYRTTDQFGTYSSVSNGVNTSRHMMTSVAVGLRYYFGKEKPKEEKPKEEPKPVPAPVVKDPNAEKVNVMVNMIDEKYNTPVAGNIVIRKGKNVVYQGTGDPAGISSFYLEPGVYTMSVNAKGYIPVEEIIDISKQGKGTKYEVKLKQPKIEKGLVFKLKAINFETGSDKMKESSYDILNKMADILKENPNMVIEVAGHTDNVGDDQKNLLLSENRAKSVMNYLLSKGVDAKQMKAVGYGETQPIADNNTEEGRLANRRVMFTVLEY